MKLTGSLTSFTTFTLVVGLYSTVTNLIPLSVLPFAWFAMLLPLMLVSATKVPTITAWAMLYYFISISSLLVYDLSALINPSFYRYDGNFLISFMPLLALPMLPRITNDIERALKLFLIYSVAISIFPSIYQFYTSQYSTGLFVATNAFGGFLMTLIALALSWMLTSKRKVGTMFLLLACTGMLALSSSRGSSLGIILGIVAYLAIRSGRKWITIALVSGIVLVQSVILSFTFPLYLDNKDDAYALSVESAESEKEANIYIRAYENWPRGLYLFTQSPIFGTGVGSANDFPLVFDDHSFFQTNLNPDRLYDSAHAHNTYLHILGEQGIIGLLTFLLMWISVYKYIISRRNSIMIRDALLIMFWSLTFASFTEHRIPSPSNVFPFIIIFILFFMKNKKEKEVVTIPEIISPSPPPP